MAIRMPAGAKPSRRTFLSSAGSATIATGLDGVASPYLSRAADRPRITHGVQSGDVSIDLRRGLGARRPAVAHAGRGRDHRQLQATSATRPSSTRCRRATSPPRRCSKTCRPGRTSSTASASRICRRRRSRRAAGRALPHRAGRPALGVVRLVGRHRRAGLGHRRVARRHAHLRDDAEQPAGLLHPLRRQHLRRLSDRAAAEAAERRALEQHRHRGEVEGRRDARRVPRQLQIQSARPQSARLQRRGADLRAMGRPRGHQRLVPGDRSARRRLSPRRACSLLAARGGRAFHEFMPTARRRWPKPAASIARSPTARCSTCSCSTCAAIAAPNARRARRATARTPISRRGATRLAQARTDELARDLEGDRRRPADRR